MDLEVVPDNWILPNRIAYNKFVYNTFHPSKYAPKLTTQACDCDKKTQQCDISSKAISLFPQQRIVRDFIQINSPYRGILLYHELGSGKSGASIAAAEGYVGRKRVFVMTPASLAQNYENELMKISSIGLNMKKSWTQVKVDTKNTAAMKVLKETYAITNDIIKKDGLVWIPLYQNDIPDTTVITQNKTYSSLSTDEKQKIDDTIVHIIKNRYTFISYNGLTQKLVNQFVKTGFDNSFVIIDEVHNFISRIVNGSKLARGIYNALMEAKDCKLVLLSGTPIINNPYEIATLINLIRGPMIVYKLKLLKASIEPSNEQIVSKLTKDDLFKYIDEVHFNKDENNIYVSVLPDGFVKNNQKIELQNWKMTNNKLIEQIINSLKNVPNLKIGVIPSTTTFYALPNKKEEFDKHFMDMTDIDNPKVKNIDLFQRRILGTLSYYRTTGTEYFPTVLPNNIQFLPMTDHQFSVYTDIRKKERDMDTAQKRHNNDVMSEKSSVYRAFSRLVCNFVFPENIKRLFPQDVKKLMKKELGVDDDDDEDDDDTDKDAKSNQKKVKEEYDKNLEKALKEVSQGDYLSIQNLQNIYSPKYAKMITDIQESPGTVLIYSQFRTMEGLGIFSKVMDREGFKEIVIKKTDEGYIFDDTSIFDKKYDNKRYVVFNSDRIKTNIMMNMFNGSFSLLPDSILHQIPDEYKEINSQLYGKLVKIMMITQSGAEGISLKNVRRVLIMEYFWNSVRINQVIGRAVRACSHEMLPKDERNVQIFTYIMSLTKKQKEDFTIRTLDKELTTDQHILQLATKKDNIVNQFLNMLKAASFDCIINSVQNKPIENGYKCYNWAINSNDDDLAYTENIADEHKIQKHQKFQVLKRNKGVVVSTGNNKYVMINNKLYDYFSYKNAGILLSI